jgi:hypothetical protein
MTSIPGTTVDINALIESKNYVSRSLSTHQSHEQFKRDFEDARTLLTDFSGILDGKKVIRLLTVAGSSRLTPTLEKPIDKNPLRPAEREGTPAAILTQTLRHAYYNIIPDFNGKPSPVYPTVQKLLGLENPLTVETMVNHEEEVYKAITQKYPGSKDAVVSFLGDLEKELDLQHQQMIVQYTECLNNPLTLVDNGQGHYLFSASTQDMDRLAYLFDGFGLHQYRYGMKHDKSDVRVSKIDKAALERIATVFNSEDKSQDFVDDRIKKNSEFWENILHLPHTNPRSL